MMNINTKEGIREYIKSLEGLSKLVEQRHKSSYKDKTRLNWFLIMGRWILDECGNTCKIIGDFIPKEKIGRLDDVLTRQEFMDTLDMYDRMTKPNVLTSEEARNLPYEQTKGRPWPTSISSSLGRPQIVPPNVKCPVCLKTWTIENCHDIVERHESKSIDLKEYEGKTIPEINHILSEKDDAEYYIPSSDMFNPKYSSPENNKSGHFVPDKGHIVEKNDSGILNIWKFYHLECNRIERAVSEQKYFSNIFEKAGFTTFFLTAILNEYCSCEKCGPWFNIDTPYGKFKIGWRKRVINIEFEGLNLSDLFKEEDVTKGKDHIHAWGKEKAIEYLKKIRELLS